MNSIALSLVIASALCHATWNLLVKRAEGGPVFVWLFMTLSSVVLVPAAVVFLVVGQQNVAALATLFILGSSLLHLVYFLLLQRAYQVGDLSLVYPLARGLGPTLATVFAIVLLEERPTPLALAGLALVVLGVVVLTFRRADAKIDRPESAISYGVMTGVLISAYTVWDKYAVSHLRVSPLILEAFVGLSISLLLTPLAIRNWASVAEVWRVHWAKVVGVAVLAPVSYILVLTAMAFTPLSYVAPAREISILFAALLGTRFLSEGYAVRRIAAACSMICGLVALAVG